MIRSVLLAFAFLAVTVGLLFLSPSSSNDGKEEFVTRLESGLTNALPSTDSVARTQTGQPLADVPRATAPTGQMSDQDQVTAMTRNIISALRAPQTASSSAPRQPVPAPTTVPAPASATVAPQDTGLRQQLLDAYAEGGTLFELEDIVRAAADAKEIDVDAAHFASSGQLDARALLATFVPELIVAPVTPPAQSFYYRIRPEDSLAGLALTFYGAPDLHSHIVAANAETISSPQDIFPGKLIEVPTLNN